MRSNESTTASANVVPSDLIPIPVALYEFNGIIYELYRGSQPRQSFKIRWHRLKTVEVAREDSVADVNINQSVRQLMNDHEC